MKAFPRAVPILLAAAIAGAAEPKQTFGWRGNWTGLFPNANPPVEWGKIAKGVVAGMTCQAAKPTDGAPKAGQPVDKGFIRDWLAIGPFAVADSMRDFDKEQIPDEAKLAPVEGDRAPGAGDGSGDRSGEVAWKRLEIKRKPDYEYWGTPLFESVDLAGAVGFKANQVAYAHTYLHCERAGTVAMVVDHAHGLKVWANGEVVYRNPDRGIGLGNYVGISRYKQTLTHGRSPRFQFALKRGWNRLLVKISTDPRGGWQAMNFTQRLIDPEPVPYEEKNILWMTELPERTNACPIVVGDRIFTPAEPDELLCLDKATGKILWRRFNSLYDAIPDDERAANPVFKDQIEPLASQRAETMDYEKGLELRRKMGELLAGVDKKKYTLRWDGHLASHFGIVGFTTTPVSDGKRVYAFFGYGVVACYDLDGNRKWIRRMPCKEIVYSCSPALSGGRLIVIFEGMHAFDCDTGAPAWSAPEARSIASLIPIHVNGIEAVATRDGEVYSASDGKHLWDNPMHKDKKREAGWGAGVVISGVFYTSFVSMSGLLWADFSNEQGDAWQAKPQYAELAVNHRRPNGEWLDRSSPASPLIHDGLYYGIDEYGVLYCYDVKARKTLYVHETGFDELHHYNAIGVAASPMLGGKHVYVMDNQGSCLVFETGREFKQTAMNRIETVIQRDWPIPPQETLANGPPVFGGSRIYIRGEKFLYCIGEK